MFKQLTLTLGIAMLCAQLLRADANGEARQIFDSLYDAKVKAALATRDSADDLALATELLAAARNATESPKLMVIMSEQAQKLAAADIKGYEVAIEAWRLLASADEAQYVAATEGIIDLRRKLLARAKMDQRVPLAQALSNDIVELATHKTTMNDHAGAANLYRQALVVARQYKLPDLENVRLFAEQANGRQQLEDRIASLQSRLLQTADKATAVDLVMIYIIDLNNPKEAVKFTDRCGDEQLKSRVALAAGDASNLTEAQALDLATWYRALSSKAQGIAQANTLQRAATYYERYLDMHTGSNLQRTGAQLALKEIQKAIEALGIPGTAGGKADSPGRTAPDTGVPPTKDKGKLDPEPVVRAQPSGKGDTQDITKFRSQLDIQLWVDKKIAHADANKPLPTGEWVELLGTINPKKHIVRGWKIGKNNTIDLPQDSSGVFYVPFEIRGDYEVLIYYELTRANGTVQCWFPTQHGHIQFGRNVDKNAEGSLGWIEIYSVTHLEKTVQLRHLKDIDKFHTTNLPNAGLYVSLRDIPKDIRPMVFELSGVGATIKNIRVRLLNGEAKPTP